MAGKRDEIPTEKEKIAFSSPEHKGFTAIGWYMKESNFAMVEVFRDGEEYTKLYPPAYKVFNIMAHFMDMVDAQLSKESIHRAVSPVP